MPGPEPVVLLLTDPDMASHAWPGHPERPERAEAAAAGVADGARAAGAELLDRTAEPVTLEAAAAVHHRAYLDWLVQHAEMGGAWLDPDTYLVEGSVDAALSAAGQGAAAAIAAAEGMAAVAFAVTRPPGHHAFADTGRGFCLLNNAVLAVSALRAAGVARRVAILDWDVHHGDGTQHLVRGDPAVFYGSSHQFPWYPGSGEGTDRDATTVNVPLPAGSDDEALTAAWTAEILPAVAAFRPEALVVSAGYDAHRDDPLAGLEATAHGFGTVAEAVGALARNAGVRGVALVLEGGYDLEAIRTSVAATVVGLLSGLSGGATARAGDGGSGA